MTNSEIVKSKSIWPVFRELVQVPEYYGVTDFSVECNHDGPLRVHMSFLMKMTPERQELLVRLLEGSDG